MHFSRYPPVYATQGIYLFQNFNFHTALRLVGALVFDHLYRKQLACRYTLTLDNLAKRTLAQQINHTVSTQAHILAMADSTPLIPTY